MAWQKIETAPKDGTAILGFWSYVYDTDPSPTCGIDVIEWDRLSVGEGWIDRDGLANPSIYTHWMPLPSPPEAE